MSTLQNRVAKLIVARAERQKSGDLRPVIAEAKVAAVAGRIIIVTGLPRRTEIE